jgi:hypothetical protein
MTSEGGQSFQCDQCGRRMRWSATIAGKMGRCKCGATFRVPDEIDPPAEEDLLSALERPAGPMAQGPAIAQGSPRSAALHYYAPARPPSDADGTTSELVREIYIPAGVLVLGFVGILAWLGYHGRLVAVAIVVTFLLAGTAMVIKTIALGLFAWYLARKSGGSFGNPWSTILKIAGLVVALDVSILWTFTAMVAAGAITPSGRIYVGKTLLLLFLVTFVVAAVVAQLLYGLHDEEANLFSRFIAGGNLVMNILLVVVLALVAHAMAAAARQARAAASASVPAATAPVPTGSAPSAIVVTTVADRKIASRLNKGDLSMVEGQEWKTSIAYDKNAQPAGLLIDHLYNAGARKVYVDMFGGRRTGRAFGPRVYVDLPLTPKERAACFDVAAEFILQNGHSTVSPTTPTTARFLEIDVNP